MSREWIDKETQEKINQILNFIPVEVMEHALDLLEKIVYRDPTEQRRKVVYLMWKHCTTEAFTGGCFSTSKYNRQHELCWYLDGWIWKVECLEKGDPDLVHLMLRSLNT